MKKESMKKEIIELIEQIDNTRYLRIIRTYLIGLVKG